MDASEARLGEKEVRGFKCNAQTSIDQMTVVLVDAHQAVTEIRAPLCSASVLDITIVGPIILCLAGLDVVLHIALDFLKIRGRPQPAVQVSEFAIPSVAIAAVGVSTLLSFFLVLLLILLWVGILNPVVIPALVPVLDPSSPILLESFLVLLIQYLESLKPNLVDDTLLFSFDG